MLPDSLGSAPGGGFAGVPDDQICDRVLYCAAGIVVRALAVVDPDPYAVCWQIRKLIPENCIKRRSGILPLTPSLSIEISCQRLANICQYRRLRLNTFSPRVIMSQPLIASGAKIAHSAISTKLLILSNDLLHYCL